MKTIVAIVIACGLGSLGAAEFEKPVRLSAGGELIKVESPGYASPCLADLDGDGVKDLLVGQFKNGNIQVFPGSGAGKFGKGDWLTIGDKRAQVPGVW